MIMPGKLLRTCLLTVALTALCTIGASAACLGAGTVTADALRLRDTPATDGAILATAPSNAKLVVLEEAGDGWYKVSYNAVEGYMAGEYLTVSTSMDAALGYGKVNSDVSSLNIRSGAGTGCSVLSSVSGGTVLELTGVQDGWYKVVHGGTSGYVSSDYITLTSETPAATVAASSVGEEIAAYAQNFLGTPYVYGGSSTSGFDCSGFTKYVYGQFGYTLNRTATDQLSNGVSVRKDERSRRSGVLQIPHQQAGLPCGHLHRQRPVRPCLYQQLRRSDRRPVLRPLRQRLRLRPSGGLSLLQI